MLRVKVQRIITRPDYQMLGGEVRLHGFDRLTPRAARAALEIAFGQGDHGVVWWQDYGYRVYPASCRKVWRDRIEQ